MAERRGSRWRMACAVMLFAAPGVAVLLLLAGAGALAWGPALGGGTAVGLGAYLLLRPHFAHIRALRGYVESLPAAGTRPDPLPPRPPGYASILMPELESAIVETAQERSRRRRELEAAMAGNASILAALPDALVMIDRNRRIVRINAAAESLFGTNAAGKSLTAVLRHPGVLAAAEAAIAGRSAEPVDVALHGEIERHLSARGVALDTPALDGTVAILALHDLTEARRAEQMRVDFVANASHELRTPLSSLLGFIETLQGPARDDPQARERFLAIMHEQATRMSRLVEDLLSLSRIEMHEHTPPSRPVDLAEVLRKVVAGLQLRAERRGMTLELAVAPPTLVVGERDELAQVFQNLIDNAIKYGREKTEVRVATRRLRPGEDPLARRLGRPGVAVSVTDRGEGIARSHLPRLTERFYRVDTARSRELGGTGLGLAIVKHIVSRHRGLLTIDSTVGEGSTFTVALPAAASSETEVAAEGARQPV